MIDHPPMSGAGAPSNDLQQDLGALLWLLARDAEGGLSPAVRAAGLRLLARVAADASCEATLRETALALGRRWAGRQALEAGRSPSATLH